MRRLPVLKTIVSIVLFLSVIVLIFTIPAYVMLLVMPATVPFKFNGQIAENLGAEYLILLLLFIAGYAFMVYALYLFKKVLDLFSKQKFFDNAVITLFDQIGKAILIGYFIAAVPAFLYNLVTESKWLFELGFSFDSGLFIIAMGLFFMALSEVFLIAKDKKDNITSEL